MKHAASVAPREDRRTVGIAWMALAVVFFTCIDTSAKWLITEGLVPLQVVFARYAGHFLLSLVLFLPQEGTAALRSYSPGRQFFRALFLGSGTMLNFAALFYLPLTVTTTIMFAGPIVVTLLAIPVLGEVVGLRRLVAVIAGFVGVLVVIQPWGAEFHPAMFLSLGALLCASGYFIMTRRLAGVESNATGQIWTSGIPTLALAPLALPVWNWPQTPADLAVLLAIGIFGSLGHIVTTHAHRLADASILAPVIYIQIVLAAVAGIVFFNTWPTTWTLLGGAIIIGSGLYIWQRERALAIGG